MPAPPAFVDRTFGRIALLVVASAAFATSSPLARGAAPIAPVTIASVRCVVACLCLLAAGPRAIFRSIVQLSTANRWRLAGGGALLAAHFALFLSGLATTSLPAAVALVSLEPLGVVLTAWALFGLRPTRLEGAGIVVATLGALVVASGAGQGEHRLAGDLLVVGSVALYGFYVAAARGLRDAMPMAPYAASVYGVSALVLAPFAVHLSASPSVPSAPLGSWLCVLGLGIVPTLLGHTLVQYASRHISPTLVALVSTGETVGSLVLGALLFAALPSTREALGIVVVLAGATLAIRGTRPGPPHEPPVIALDS